MPTDGAAQSITYNSRAGRWVLGVEIVGSGMAFLGSRIVNVALPAIGRDLDASGLTLRRLARDCHRARCGRRQSRRPRIGHQQRRRARRQPARRRRLPLVPGIIGDPFYDSAAMTHGFHVAMLTCAALAAAGGALAWLTISDDAFTAEPERRGEPPVAVSADYSCSVAGPP